MDCAYSDQLIEHLHPDDAITQLRAVYEALRPGGIYLCITPNRLTGPHDVSRGFDVVATGFHLREYSLSELTGLYRAAGLRQLRSLFGGNGRDISLPVAPQQFLERASELLPHPLRQRLGNTLPMRIALSVKLLAFK